MSSNRRSRRRTSSHGGEFRAGTEVWNETESCALYPEDDYAGSRRRGKDRKARMLCAQVERALGFALEEEAPRLADQVMVESVEPYPHAGRLLVLLREVARAEADAFEIQELVRESKGRLRTSVANYINRKRAPDLVLVVILAEEMEFS